ncbi:MAG: ABC transporter permease subunit, partial [Clostridia bacterium]|nr:ABC transporter permease subunit [Clostridia bacterium]
AADWAPPCAALTRVAALGTGSAGLRQTLAQSFQAWQVIGPDGPTGLFTGYYETTLDASPTRLPGYATPLYALPPGWENPAPRPDRAAIEDGALNGVATVLLWARDPIDVFFLHIQGSGVARLPDGRRVRIGYAGNNGHPFVGIGGLMRYTRTNMLEVLSADYIRTARAKGLSERRVINYHAFRNTLIPIVTIIGGTLPSLFSGALITETLFGISGIGKTSFDAMVAGDIPFSMFFMVFLAVLTLLGTLIADILYAVVDPRVRVA